MVTFITIIFSIISLIAFIGYVLILSGFLPMQLSIIYSVLSLYFYYLNCQNNIDAKKIRLYNIRNFVEVIFLNVLSVLFIIGLILTLVIMKIDNKLIKKWRELRIYVTYTMCVGILFEGGKILVPFLHKKYPFILDIIHIIFLIIGIISVRKMKKNI